MLKEEYVNLINESQSKDLSPESSNMNDSDASRYVANKTKSIKKVMVAKIAPSP